MSERCPYYSQPECHIASEVKAQTDVFINHQLRPDDPRKDISRVAQIYIDRVNKIRLCATYTECNDIQTLEERVQQLQNQINQK